MYTGLFKVCSIKRVQQTVQLFHNYIRTFLFRRFVLDELASVQFLHDFIFCFESDFIVVSYSSSTGFLREDAISFGKPNQL